MKSWLDEPLKSWLVDEVELLLVDDMLFVVTKYRLTNFERSDQVYFCQILELFKSIVSLCLRQHCRLNFLVLLEIRNS